MTKKELEKTNQELEAVLKILSELYKHEKRLRKMTENKLSMREYREFAFSEYKGRENINI